MEKRILKAIRTCLAGCLVAVALAACSREPTVVTYRVPKQRPVTASPSASAGVTWELPGGWQTGKGSSMRMASFSVPTSTQPGDCSLVMLGGGAGGLAANVNRWRGQIGLAALSAEEIETQTQTLACKSGTFFYAKMVGAADGQSILASIFEGKDEVLFAKLNVGAPHAEGVEAAFLEFCESVSMPSQGSDAP